MTAAVARLTFLHPHVLRAARAAGPSRAAGLARHRGTFARRRGKAVEPLITAAKARPSAVLPNPIEVAAPSEDVVQSASQQATAPMQDPTQSSNSMSTTSATNESSPTRASQASSNTSQQPKTDQTPEEERAKLAREEAKSSGPLEAVLHMEPPEDMVKQGPTMSPPPYVHHFNTYSLVKQLQEGGYTLEQATTAMKAIRAILDQNLNVAQSNLVSKSDVENETYLFTAACSELSTEIKNNRRLQEEQLRQQRTHLQHEVDILTQSLNQEALTLNDNVRGMFNDRKMAVREEQKGVQSAVQKLNYKISIMLTSDAKSDIEAVRWILIRRSVLGILFMAVLTLGTLRYATYVSHERQREAERKKKEDEERRRGGGKRDHSSAPDAAAILTAN
ncbi:hypothetical protein EDB81DRAFT_159014 [Dactylonectria macrodidyma]|uniref:MOZ protein represents a chromatin-associated acetyltransferase n=1 Tax=Dactylonectria macrodidyma TaxID=307937 RepID=A0A9P9FPM5_9HYPO|nr:hypothetical protein EDB81DRAFT_159014 [Dactylonectria macrodidyma]